MHHTSTGRDKHVQQAACSPVEPEIREGKKHQTRCMQRLSHHACCSQTPYLLHLSGLQPQTSDLHHAIPAMPQSLQRLDLGCAPRLSSQECQGLKRAHLDSLDLPATVFHLLLEARAVGPGFGHDIQRADSGPIQAPDNSLPHLLVRGTVPTSSPHADQSTCRPVLSCCSQVATMLGSCSTGGCSYRRYMPKNSKPRHVGMAGDKPLYCNTDWGNGDCSIRGTYRHRKWTQQSSMPGGSPQAGGRLYRLKCTRRLHQHCGSQDGRPYCLETDYGLMY